MMITIKDFDIEIVTTAFLLLLVTAATVAQEGLIMADVVYGELEEDISPEFELSPFNGTVDNATNIAENSTTMMQDDIDDSDISEILFRNVQTTTEEEEEAAEVYEDLDDAPCITMNIPCYHFFDENGNCFEAGENGALVDKELYTDISDDIVPP